MLIIIDLQKGFLAPQAQSKTPARLRRLKKHVTQQIADAKKRRQSIVVVEYKDEGETVDWVANCIGRYKKVYKAKKTQDDAYKALRSCFKRNGLNPSSVTVCGVNTHYCVGETLKSLVRNGYEVTVPWGAVECCESRSEQRDFLEGFNGTLRVV